MIKDEFGNRRFFGIYRGIVQNNSDPLNKGRLKLQVPQVLGDAVTGWAWAVHQADVVRSIPTVETGVWVMFEGGDPSFPVWLGTFEPFASPFNYGAFQDVLTQTLAVANTGYAMKFRQTDEAHNISIVNDTKITFANAGTYNLQWSGQFQNTSVQLHDANIWVRKNGVDVPGTTGVVSIPNSHGSVAGHTIAGWNFVFTVEAGDYYEFYWSADSTGVTLQYYAATTSPPVPSTASLVLTVTQVK